MGAMTPNHRRLRRTVIRTAELRLLDWDGALRRRLRPYADVRAAFAPWRRAVLAHWDEWTAERPGPRACS